MKRVESLSTLPNQIFNRIRFSVSVVASLCLALSVLTACNNINSKFKSPSNTVQLSDPFTNASGGSFQLISLAADAVSPGTVLDLIGTGSQFDSYCALGTCMCEYSYVQSGVGSQIVSTPVTYQESNLIRCANMVPSGTNSFDIRVTVGSSAGTTASPSASSITYASNTLSGNFANGALAGSTSYIDLTNAATYVPVQRFQCRKREFIGNPLEPDMIDPFQSQNPAVIYPFNYYTTNVAQSLLTQQQSSDASWECTLNSTQDHSLQWWANPNVFSLATCTTSFCNGDGALMYPQSTLSSGKIPVTNLSATGKRRSSFHLASQSYGVFQVAVKAAISPVNYVSSNYATIGYAAKPIAGTNGTSSCPAITLPANSTWVKLWNFRATDITSAKKVTSSQSIGQSAIACDTFHPNSGGRDIGLMIFPSCEMQDNSGGNNVFGVALDDPAVTAGTKLASRVAALTGSGSTTNTSACYNFGMLAINATNFASSIPWHSGYAGGGAAAYGGNDTWIPSPYKMDNTISVSDVSGFPWNFYTNASTWSLTQRTDAGVVNQWLSSPAGSYALPSATPMDYANQLTTTSLSPDNYTDQIFVVTDPSISDTDMRNNASSIQQYVPRTYRAKSDCVGPAPCDPITTGKTPVTWGINVLEVGASVGSDTYPLCVLQFYD